MASSRLADLLRSLDASKVEQQAQEKRARLVDLMRGEIAPAPDTLSMRFGKAVLPYFNAAKGFFPESNPYGQKLQNLLLGSAPDSAQKMAEGYTNILGNFRGANPLNYRLKQEAVDMAGALPIGAAADTATKVGMLGKAGLGAKEAILAFHGSPHKFDKFDLSKIGTGEGAQAYGHGLYFAENPGVAKEYAVNLSNIDPNTARATAHQNAKTWVERLGDENYAAEVFREKADEALRNGEDATPFQETLKFIESGGYKKPLDNQGNLYHVDIPDEHIDKMLDWDKPLSEQHPDVQAAFKKLGMDESVFPHWTGQQAYEGEVRAMTEFDGVDKGSARQRYSDQLRALGIPGIKYLDAGSRGAGTGTRNFVLFDDQIPKILKRE